MKIRDSSFRTITRQRTLAEPTDMTEPIYRVALELARPELRGIRVRLLGVTASNLGEREQLAMFSDDDPKRRRAIEAADAVRRRYGDDAMTRARLLGPGCRRRSNATRATRSIGAREARDGAMAAQLPEAGSTDRDTQADTDLDDIPPDDP